MNRISALDRAAYPTKKRRSIAQVQLAGDPVQRPRQPEAQGVRVAADFRGDFRPGVALRPKVGQPPLVAGTHARHEVPKQLRVGHYDPPTLPEPGPHFSRPAGTVKNKSNSLLAAAANPVHGAGTPRIRVLTPTVGWQSRPCRAIFLGRFKHDWHSAAVPQVLSVHHEKQIRGARQAP